MPIHGIGLRHVNKRKKKGEFPHRVTWKAVLDQFIYVVAFAGPVMTIPQIYNTLILGNVAGISATTWTTYVITSIFWLTYGIVHKNRPLIMSGLLWIIANSLVVLGTIMN